MAKKQTGGNGKPAKDVSENETDVTDETVPDLDGEDEEADGDDAGQEEDEDDDL